MNRPVQNPDAAKYKILIVEDDVNERQSLQRLIADAGYQVSATDSADKAMGYLDEPIDFVLTDLQMGDVSGIDLLKHWKMRQPDTMFLVITGHGSMDSAIEAIRAGAYHYLTKPIDPQALLVLLGNMLREKEQAQKMQILQNRLDEKFSLNNIIGRSVPMQRVFELIRRSAQAFSTVLILGESGTGKELVAQAIHQNSPRRDGPFIAINCAAMPATLVESELFGHEKGAFTGATDRRVGRFEAAHGGTLFIDEIGEFEVGLQVKLLRALETRVVTPVGGHKELKVDTRVLAATSRDIRDMMAKGQFREDLYYRLNVITIELPPLRNRLEDVPLLVRKFMDRVNEQNNTKIASISAAAMDALQQYKWPGNVRELLNIVERMMVLSDKLVLDVDDLPNYVRQGAASGVPGIPGGVAATAPAAPAMNPTQSNFGSVPASPVAPRPPMNATESGPPLETALATLTLAEIEERAIAAALVRFNNNRTRAARALGISVRTLQRKLGAKNGGEGDEAEAPDEAASAPVGEPVAEAAAAPGA